MPLIVDDAGVICEAVAAVLHDDTAVFPGPRRAFAHRISDVFGDAVRRIDHIIPVTVLVEIGRFGVLGTPRVDLDRLPLIGDHISVELHHPELWVAPVEICLPVIIHKHSGVNIAPVRAAKRLANRVGERPFRAVCNSNADRSAAAVCRSHGHIIIEFAVTLDALCRPRFSACPLKGCIVQRNAEVCPVLHIRRGKAAPVVHGEKAGVALIVAGEEIKRVVPDKRCTVCGVAGLHDRICRRCRLCGSYKA